MEKIDIDSKLAEEIAEAYNNIQDEWSKTQKIDKKLKKKLHQKLAQTGHKELINEYEKLFEKIAETSSMKDEEEERLESKKKGVKKERTERNRGFEVSFSNFGRFLSRLLPPVTIRYSSSVVKEVFYEDSIEVDERDSKMPSAPGWNV